MRPNAELWCRGIWQGNKPCILWWDCMVCVLTSSSAVRALMCISSYWCLYSPSYMWVLKWAWYHTHAMVRVVVDTDIHNATAPVNYLFIIWGHRLTFLVTSSLTVFTFSVVSFRLCPSVFPSLEYTSVILFVPCRSGSSIGAASWPSKRKLVRVSLSACYSSCSIHFLSLSLWG